MPVSNYAPSYSKESPYRLTPIFGNFMAYYVHRSIDPRSDDLFVTMDNQRYTGRPDLLATDFYNSPDLWWVFGVRNGWEDPIHDLKHGIDLYIPSPTHVRAIL